MKIEISAKPRQKSTALASRGIGTSTPARPGQERSLNGHAGRRQPQPPKEADRELRGTLPDHRGEPSNWLAHAPAEDRYPRQRRPSGVADERGDKGVGNSLLAWNVQPFRMPSFEHLAGILAVEPAGI